MTWEYGMKQRLCSERLIFVNSKIRTREIPQFELCPIQGEFAISDYGSTKLCRKRLLHMQGILETPQNSWAAPQFSNNSRMWLEILWPRKTNKITYIQTDRRRLQMFAVLYHQVRMMMETFVLLKPCPADIQEGGGGEPLKATES
jgi:hypothetical protein